MKRYGVRPSLCPSVGQTEACLLSWARRSGDICRLLQQQLAASGRMREVPRQHACCTLRKIGVGFPTFRGIAYVQPLGYD